MLNELIKNGCEAKVIIVLQSHVWILFKNDSRKIFFIELKFQRIVNVVLFLEMHPMRIGIVLKYDSRDIIIFNCWYLYAV